ncbi:DUF5682 family protein [Bradyrhizobium oligotrophicum S58]
MLSALDAADPAVVLIEGPPDADELIAFAASPAMVPPVALLVHAQDDAANASFFPFAQFSPEWQAIRWALAKARPVRFIDLPASYRLDERAKAKQTERNEGEVAPEDARAPAQDGPGAVDPELAQIRRDPLAYLATLAGYDDSEILVECDRRTGRARSGNLCRAGSRDRGAAREDRSPALPAGR